MLAGTARKHGIITEMEQRNERIGGKETSEVCYQALGGPREHIKRLDKPQKQRAENPDGHGR